jgi:hypothetical protein
MKGSISKSKLSGWRRMSASDDERRNLDRHDGESTVFNSRWQSRPERDVAFRELRKDYFKMDDLACANDGVARWTFRQIGQLTEGHECNFRLDRAGWCVSPGRLPRDGLYS